MSRKKKNIEPARQNDFNAVGLAWELAGIIIIPLVCFLLLGIYLDKLFATKPLYILIGLGISFAITTYAMIVKMTKFTTELGAMSGPVVRKKKTVNQKKSKRKKSQKKPTKN